MTPPTVLDTAGTYQTALSNSWPWWSCSVRGWGDTVLGGLSIVLDSTNCPGSFRQGPQYMAIDPVSSVDTVSVNCTLPGGIDGVNVSVDCPGYMLGGPVAVVALLRYGGVYYPAGATAPAAFGSAEPRMVPPQLAMRFYPQIPPGLPPTVKRFPLAAAKKRTMVAGAENLIAIWPVSGRRSLACAFRATGTLTANVRVGLINQDDARSESAGGSGIPFEVTLGTGAVTAPAAGGANASLTTVQPCQYLAAYATLTAGAGDAWAYITAHD